MAACQLCDPLTSLAHHWQQQHTIAFLCLKDKGFLFHLKITMPHYSLKETPNNKSNKKGRNSLLFSPLNKCCYFVFLEGGKSADKQ